MRFSSIEQSKDLTDSWVMVFTEMKNKSLLIVLNIAFSMLATGCHVRATLFSFDRVMTQKTILTTSQLQIVPVLVEAPYIYTIRSGKGSVNEEGVFTPEEKGRTVIEIRSLSGDKEALNIDVVDPISIVEGDHFDLAVGNQYSFHADGGIGKPHFEMVAGDGAVSLEGRYEADSNSGSAILRVFDEEDNYYETALTIHNLPQISPTTRNLEITKSQSFATAEGVPPFTYEVADGGGFFLLDTYYSTGATLGWVHVQTVDARGNISTAAVFVYPGLQSSVDKSVITVSNLAQVAGVDGMPPYSYAVVSGDASIDAVGSLAPGTPMENIIRITDSEANAVETTVTVKPALKINPSALSLAVENIWDFSVTGGVEPFTYSLTSGAGVVDSLSGHYVAPAAPGSAQVRVVDSLGNESSSAISIKAALDISVTHSVIPSNKTVTVSGIDGVPPYSYILISGPGVIDATTGVYAPGSEGNAVLRVKDARGNIAEASVTVYRAIEIVADYTSIALNNTAMVTASYGKPPYSYSIAMGSGGVDALTGAFQPTAVGAATLRATDSVGDSADIVIMVNAILALAPSTKVLAITNTTTLGASGGVGGFTYELVSGDGHIDSASGLYEAPASPGSAVLKVTDSLGNTATGSVTINPALAATVSRTPIAANNTSTISGVSGVPGYTYAMVSGPGSVSATTGIYSPGAAGTGVVRVTDSYGNTTTVAVAVQPALTASVNRGVIAQNNNATVMAANGIPPYTYGLSSGAGSVNSSSGVFTPSGTGVMVLKATDSLGNVATASVTVNALLSLGGGGGSVIINNGRQLTASGGVPSYSYAVIGGGGSVNSGGWFVAPNFATIATVRVTDALGNIADTAMTILSITQVTVSSPANNINLRSIADSSGWVAGMDVEITIGSGVTIGSGGTGAASVETGYFPAGTNVKLINRGSIVGAGGAGGSAGWTTHGAGGDGSPGGPAMNLSSAINIDNSAGYILGGGGGGGGGGAGCKQSPVGAQWVYGGGGGGGGGAGQVGGAGGPLGIRSSTSMTETEGQPGGGSGGAGGASGMGFNGVMTKGGVGGNGGEYGSAGGNGGAGDGATPCLAYAGGNGGAAGKAINVNGNGLNWLGGNNGSQVRGGVY